MGKFEIYIDKAWESRFRLKAGNGQIILASEWYSAKAWCENGIESVRENSADDKKFERKEISSGFRFNLKAGNGQVIWTSQTYSSKDAMENGIASVAENAPDAVVEEV